MIFLALVGEMGEGVGIGKGEGEREGEGEPQWNTYSIW